MTLSVLKRLRTLPAIALALLLAVALAGCSSAETSEEPAAPAPAEEPATPETPAAEEPEEPATEFDTQQREPVSQESLIASIDSYAEGDEEPSRQTCAYDDAGRLTSLTFDEGGLGTKWTYDANGNLLTQVEDSDYGDTAYTSTITYKYNDEGLPVERTYETTQPDTYVDPETGEQVDDPSQGELVEWDVPRITFEWSERGAQEQLVEYHASGEITSQTTYQLPIMVPVSVVSTDPQSISGFGVIEEDMRPLSSKTVDADGFVQSETSYQYNADGKLTSATMKNGDWTTTDTRTYDEHGNITSDSYDYGDGDAQTVTYEWTYDSAGNPTELIVRDPEMGDTYEFFTYDSKGRLKARVSASLFEGEYSLYCGVFNYLVDDEALSATPQQLMDDARAKMEAA